jgi:hypothetical protein
MSVMQCIKMPLAYRLYCVINRLVCLKYIFTVALLAAMSTIALPAHADDTPASGYSNAAKILAGNYVRPGWRLVDGKWVRPQAKFHIDDLVRLVEEEGRHRVVSLQSPRVEPLIKNWRTVLIELADSNYAWKMSAPGRLWDDARIDTTQHFQLIAATDQATANQNLRLTKIDITPQQQIIQAVIASIDDQGRPEPISFIVVLGRDFAEATISGFNAQHPRVLIRSTSLRQLLIDHPKDARESAVPVLKLLSSNGENPLMPLAGDVYRAFNTLSASEETTRLIRALVKDLSASDFVTRTRASRELASLGRRGVQAAMQFNTTHIPPEAAERIAFFIAQNTHDARPADVLLKDSAFLYDCMTDPDPAVRTAAADIVRANK